MSQEVQLCLEECVNTKRQLKKLKRNIQKQYWKLICDNSNKIKNWHYVSDNVNITPDIVINNPNVKWEWSNLCCNPSIPLWFIERNLDKKLSWENISKRPDLTEAFIDKYSDKPWDWYYIALNRNISVVHIKKYTRMSRHKLWYYTIYNNMFQNSNTSLDDINKYRWTIISRSPNLTIDMINQTPLTHSQTDGQGINQKVNQSLDEKYTDDDNLWDWGQVSMNSSMTELDVQNNPQLPWIYDSRILYAGTDRMWSPCSLSSNINLTMDFVNKYSPIVWNWTEVSSNVGITMVDVNSNPQAPWDYDAMIHNPNINIEVVMAHIPDVLPLEKQWLKGLICMNPIVTISHMESLVKSYASKRDNPRSWSWRDFSFNPNLTVEYVSQHIRDIDWDWAGISCNSFYGGNDGQIHMLEQQHKQQVMKLVKAYYWLTISKLSLPPLGYYFLNDVRTTIPDDSKSLFDALRSKRDFNRIKLLFLS